MRDSFIFYRSFYEQANKLNKSEQLSLLKAICELALNEQETELKGISSIIYEMAKPLILANEKRFKNGCKGGRPKDDDSPRKDFGEYETVILTETQWTKILAKYGENLALKMVKVLDDWLSIGGHNAKQYIGKNNYAHFRKDYWVYQEAKKLLEKEEADNQPNWSV